MMNIEQDAYDRFIGTALVKMTIWIDVYIFTCVIE